MKIKKSLVSVVMLLVIIVIFAGCSKDKDTSSGEVSDNFNETEYPIVDEPITLEMMGKSSPVQPEWGDMGFFKEMKELTNIDFKFRTASEDDYKTKKKLAFGSLELPDLFYGGELTTDEVVDYGSQELLIPLEDLIEDYAPNLTKLMEEHPDLKPSITTPDGHIYALPGLDLSTQSKTPIMWLNGPWLDKLGLDKPSTTEEFYEMLKKFKEEDPGDVGDVVPLTAGDPKDLRVGFLPNFGIVQDEGVFETDGEAGYAYVQDEFKEYLKYMNRLYEEKLLDNEMFSHTWEEFIAKGDKIGVFSTWPIVQVGFEDPAEALNYPILPPLTSATNDEKLTLEMSEVRRGRAAITSENEHPEATMRWLDYMYSEEGSILSRLGIEGETFEWNEDETLWTLLSKDGLSTTETNAQHAPGVGTNVPMVIGEVMEKEDNPTILEINENLAEELLPHAKLPFPLVYFTVEEQEELNIIKPDIESYFEQMEAKFITGAESIEDTWDEYVSTLTDLGIDKLVEIYQDAYDRWADEK